MVRPLHKFVAKTVGLTLLSGLAFHVAMDNAIATRPDREKKEKQHHDSSLEADSFVNNSNFMMMQEVEEENHQQQQRQQTGNDVVHNQNQAFKRFLRDLEGKDTMTKIEDAARSMEYFMNPQSLDVDVKLKRTQRPGDPIMTKENQQSTGRN